MRLRLVKPVEGCLGLSLWDVCLFGLLLDNLRSPRRILELILVLILRLGLGLTFTCWFDSVLGTDFVVLEQSLEDLHALVVPLLAEEIADLEDLVFHLQVGLIQDEAGLESLDLGLEQAEGVRIGNFHVGSDFEGQLLVRLAQLFAAVGVCAVLAEVTLLFLLEVLADLGLVVVVGDVQHLVLHLDG